MTDNAGWVHVDFYGRAPDTQAVTGVNVPVVAAELMQAFGFTHIDKLTATRVAHPENAISSNLIAVWEMFVEVPYDMRPSGLVPWCEKNGIDPATAALIARKEYEDGSAEVFVRYQVPEGTEGAKFAGFIPR